MVTLYLLVPAGQTARGVPCKVAFVLGVFPYVESRPEVLAKNV